MKNDGERLGMHIKGGLNGQKGNPVDATDEGVFVSKINSSGAARRDGRLKVIKDQQPSAAPRHPRHQGDVFGLVYAFFFLVLFVRVMTRHNLLNIFIFSSSARLECEY